MLAAGLALPEAAVVSAPGSIALHEPPPLSAPVVWLRADPATLAARLATTRAGGPGGSGGSGGDRPDLGTVAAVDAARRPGFAALATVVVDVDGRSVEEIVDEIVARLDALPGFSPDPSVTVAGCDPQQSS